LYQAFSLSLLLGGSLVFIDDATKKAAVKADCLFAKALLVLQAKDQTDTEVA
jgi:hypothetical protein